MSENFRSLISSKNFITYVDNVFFTITNKTRIVHNKVDTLKLAEITIKLDEETEIFKLQYVNNIQTTTSYKNHIKDFDYDFAKKSPKSLK